MNNRGRSAKLVGEFAGLTIDFCYLFHDVACLSYVKTSDIEKEKVDIYNDIDTIQKRILELVKVAQENNINIDIQAFNSSSQEIREAISQIQSKKDLEKYIRYYQDGMHDNDLVDKIAYQFYSEFMSLYYKVLNQVTSESIFPYKTQPALVSYGEISRNPQSAIQQSFTIFEDYLRSKIGADADLFGEELINKAFGKDGLLVYSNIPAEQNGVRNLVSGFYATFRNPHMHRVIKIEESQSLSIISTLYMLINIVNNSRAR